MGHPVIIGIFVAYFAIVLGLVIWPPERKKT